MAQPAALTDQTLLSTDPQAMALSRQQQMADLLTQNSMQQPTGQVISGRYVAPSWSQQLQPLFNAAAGAYLSHNVENKQQALAEALRGKQQEAVKNYANATTPQERFAAGTSQYAPAELQKAAYSMVAPQKLGEGETLQQLNFGTGQYTPLAAGAEKLPPDEKGYNLAKSQNYPGSFIDYKKELNKASANNISVNMGKSIAEQIGPMLKDSQAQAVSAIRGNDAANKILQAIETNKSFTGPGANFQVIGAQLADKAGIGGADTAAKLANTRNAIQGLAQMTLEGRQQMRGQGAISNSEGQLAEKVSSGDINNLSSAEIAQLARAAKRYNDYTISQHNNKLNVLRKDPNSAGLAPFYEVNPMQPQSSSGVKYLGPAQ